MPVFAKTPAKTGSPPTKKKLSNQQNLLQQSSLFRLSLSLLRRNHHSSRHLVLILKIQQLNSLRTPPSRPNTLSINANDLPKLADHHHLSRVIHQLNASNLANLRR